MIPELHLGIQVGSIPASGTNNLTLKIYEKVQTTTTKTTNKGRSNYYCPYPAHRIICHPSHFIQFLKMKVLFAFLTAGILYSCSVSKHNEPSRLHYPEKWIYHQASIHKIGYGFFLSHDSTEVLFVPRNRKKFPMVKFYRIDNDFIYIPNSTNQ